MGRRAAPTVYENSHLILERVIGPGRWPSQLANSKHIGSYREEVLLQTQRYLNQGGR